MGNELIISIGRQLNIPGKVDNEWMCRVIYSIAGQMGLASLWDYDEDEDTVSIQHFKERIAEIFAAYEELYPSIKFIFPEKKSDLIDEIYHIYLRSGFFYHSADEAHMYRGSAGGEVSFLIRRLFHRLGIDRSRVQFILTTASMPNKNEEDRRVIQTFANDLTASDDGHEFHYLAGQQEEIGSGRAYDISFDRFTKAHPESFEGDNAERLLALNKFWEGIIDSPAPFSTDNSAYQWLYDHLVDYVPFRELFKLCRGRHSLSSPVQSWKMLFML